MCKLFVVVVAYIQQFCQEITLSWFPLTVYYCCGEAMKHTKVKRHRIISEGVTTDTPTQNCSCGWCAPREDHVYTCPQTCTHTCTHNQEKGDLDSEGGGCWCKQTEKNPGLLDTPHTMNGEKKKRRKEKKVWIYPLFQLIKV